MPNSMLKYATSRSSSSPLARCHQLTASAVTSDTARKLALRAAVLLDEGECAIPGVGGRVRELLELAVEEAVRSAVVDRDLVLDARLVESALELLDDVNRDPLVRAAHQRENRRLQLGRLLRRADRAVAADPRPAVEADRSGKAVPAGG